MIDRKIRDLIALLLQKNKWIIHRCMLDGCRDDVSARTLIRDRGTDQCQIVALGAAGGKQNLFFRYLENLCDLSGRCFYIVFGSHTLHMQ